MNGTGQRLLWEAEGLLKQAHAHPSRDAYIMAAHRFIRAGGAFEDEAEGHASRGDWERAAETFDSAAQADMRAVTTMEASSHVSQRLASEAEEKMKARRADA